MKKLLLILLLLPLFFGCDRKAHLAFEVKNDSGKQLQLAMPDEPCFGAGGALTPVENGKRQLCGQFTDPTGINSSTFFDEMPDPLELVCLEKIEQDGKPFKRNFLEKANWVFEKTGSSHEGRAVLTVTAADF